MHDPVKNFYLGFSETVSCKTGFYIFMVKHRKKCTHSFKSDQTVNGIAIFLAFVLESCGGPPPHMENGEKSVGEKREDR